MFCGFRHRSGGDFAVQNQPQFHKKGSFRIAKAMVINMATVRKSGLGRGLESVFTDNNIQENDRGRVSLRINQIQPRKGQPREVFDEEALNELSSSIIHHGVIQPIAVRPTANGMYEIVAGERRWRAAKQAGLTEIPVVVTELDDKKTVVVSLIENIQRENLNPIEIAKSMKKIIDENDLTQEEIAQTLGKSRSGVANYLRLLELPERTKSALADGRITLGHAKVLAVLGDEADDIIDEIIEKCMSVRDTEALVKKISEPKKVKTQNVDKLVLDYKADLEQRVTKKLGRRAKLSGRGKSKRIELYYEDENDLEEILSVLCGKDFFEE